MKWLVVIGVLVFASCECVYDYSYEIKNETDGKLTIALTNNTAQYNESIGIGTSDTLFVTDHGIEQCRKGPFYQEVSIDIETISVWKDDTLLSTRDY